MSDNKSRDIFYGVVAIATLIVALIGATLAYFSISTNSDEGAVNAKAAKITVEYEDGKQVSMAAQNLIPAKWEEVVKKVYERITLTDEGGARPNVCIDDNGKEVCSIYRFSLKSDVATDFVAKLNTEYNGFERLSYAVRDVTNRAWIKLNGNDETLGLNACDADDSTDAGECFTGSGDTKTYSANNPKAINSLFGYNTDNTFKTINIGNTEQTYDIVLFLQENDENQNYEQGKEFQGTIYVETTGGADRITGFVNE